MYHNNRLLFPKLASYVSYNDQAYILGNKHCVNFLRPSFQFPESFVIDTMNSMNVKIGLAAGFSAFMTALLLGVSKMDNKQIKLAQSHSKSHLKVMVSGAAGQIAYSLLPLLASGKVFGPNTRITLHLLDIEPCLPALVGVVMELEDGSYPLLEKILTTSDPEVALKDVDVAVFVGGFPRGPGMERKDLIAKNCGIFSVQGKALEKVASKNVKVLVVANPANTNCLILRANAPSIPDSAFTCLTRLDFNRAKSQIAMKCGVNVDDVKNVTIWGNHSATQVPDAVTKAVIQVNGKTIPVPQVVKDEQFLREKFVVTVQQRGKAVIDARKLSSAMSAANAIGDHLRTWLVTGSGNETVPMGVVSNGAYGIKKGLIYSFPLRISQPGQYEIVKDWEPDAFIIGKMKASEKELLEEQVDAEAALANQKN